MRCWRGRHGDPSTVAVGIEVPRGAPVELLVERGFAVYAINPKQMDRFAIVYAGGAKDDRRDALVIGDSLRTDPQAFRPVRLDHPVTIQLREWSRIDEELGVELTRLTNQLRDLVYRSAPGCWRFSRGRRPWFWTMLRHASTPAQATRLSERRLHDCCATTASAGSRRRSARGVAAAAVFTAPGRGRRRRRPHRAAAAAPGADRGAAPRGGAAARAVARGA